MRHKVSALVFLFLLFPPAALSKSAKSKVMPSTWGPRERSLSFLLPKWRRTPIRKR